MQVEATVKIKFIRANRDICNFEALKASIIYKPEGSKKGIECVTHLCSYDPLGFGGYRDQLDFLNACLELINNRDAIEKQVKCTVEEDIKKREQENKINSMTSKVVSAVNDFNKLNVKVIINTKD